MPVLSELATMTEVAQGTSLARFGHGELMIMAREDAEHQKWDARLASELVDILYDSPCLIAIPPHDPPGWDGFMKNRGAAWIDHTRWYGSSFVSRHDWVPWTDEYRKLLHSLWENRSVTLLSPDLINLKNADTVFWLEVPYCNAYDNISILAYQETFLEADLVILSCGPTGTVLADRLARKGIWAVDLGNFGKFL